MGRLSKKIGCEMVATDGSRIKDYDRKSWRGRTTVSKQEFQVRKSKLKCSRLNRRYEFFFSLRICLGRLKKIIYRYLGCEDRPTMRGDRWFAFTPMRANLLLKVLHNQNPKVLTWYHSYGVLSHPPSFLTHARMKKRFLWYQ